MSSNRGAAVQIIVRSSETSARTNQANPFTISGVSRWEPSDIPMHIFDVYQVNEVALNPESYLPGRWSKNVG